MTLDNTSDNKIDNRPLYSATFMMAASLSVLWTAMPFIVRNIGGTEDHVGYILAANMLGYMLCLMPAARMLGHLSPRKMTKIAVATVISANFVMFSVAAVAAGGRCSEMLLVWTMIGAATVAGGAMSLFWPFLMTWVSADLEGPALNRQLGTYNGMWSAASIAGPFIGGTLVDINTMGPIAVSMAALLTCLIMLSLARDDSAIRRTAQQHTDAIPIVFDKKQLKCFKWMSRVVLFCSWACLAVSRSQFALLFTSLGYSETQFGILITMFSICNFAVLTSAGRLAFWHFRPTLLIAVQLILACSLLMIIFSTSIVVFAIAFIMMGCAFGFAYSSHLYYGACGSKKRSGPMAVHEITISLGVIVGSGGGGYIAKTCGTYWPYWFALTVLTLGLIGQLIVWTALKPDSRTATNSPSA